MNSRKECPMRHTNGNCLVIGGFCTSVSDEYCNGLREAYLCGALREMRRNKWVSVNDRLPNDGQDVLAYLYNGEETRIAPFNYDKGTWYDCVMNCTVAINSITHWMPLPDPPKEVSE